MDVKVYTTPTCGYCHQVKDYLHQRGVSFTEYDVSRDRNAAQEIVDRTGQMGVPVIIVDGETVIGFDRPHLDALLSRASSQKRLRFGLKIGNAPGGGAVIGSVAAGSLGARVGLTSGDVVTGLNTETVRNADDMEHFLTRVTPGSLVSVRFRRGGQERKSEILAS